MLFGRLVFDPVHFIMERKMMLGIKQRAENAGRATSSLEPSAVSSQLSANPNTKRPLGHPSLEMIQ